MTTGNDDDLLRMADDAEEDARGLFVRRRRRMEDFRYDEAQAAFWDITTGTLLKGISVNGAIPREFWPTRPDGRNGRPIRFPPAEAINDVDTGLTVEGSTWWPGLPVFIHDTVITPRGAVPQRGACTYNTYIPPDHSTLRNDRNPDKWIAHVKFLFPDPVEHEHFFDFAAHMVQRPDEKVNHGIVIAGPQGIGKDTALLPLRRAVGEWNVAEIKPDAIGSQYNRHVESVLLIINEVRPHDEDFKASNFYNQLKPLLASPPEMLPMEMKYANIIYVRNLCHVVLTTNDPLTMYVPEEDRRLFIMTSQLPDPKKIPVFAAGYFDGMYEYLRDGGTDAVVRWLRNRDISHFQPGHPPPMTAGKEMIISSAHEVRRSKVDDVVEAFVLEVYKGAAPDVIFAKDLVDFVKVCGLFDDRETVSKMLAARNFHFKMDERGYALVKCKTAELWQCGAFRSRAAYVRKTVEVSARYQCVEAAVQKRPLEMRSAQPR